MGTTNYFNAFIEVAEDCPAPEAKVPPERGETKTVANLEYEMIASAPYEHTSDDVRFTVHAIRKGIPEQDLAMERERFFSKGQPCFRSSPLPKRYGWGVHSNDEGQIALVALGSDEYEQLAKDPEIHHLKAMRSKRR